MSDNIEVYKGIAAVTGALAKEGITKDRKNQQQGFQYRGIDDVYAALAPLLAANNLCILPRMTARESEERTSAKGGTLFYNAVTAEFDIVSSLDGSKHTVSSYGEAFDSGDKSIGKAMSYAYKSMAFMTFAIPTEGENDPDAHSHEVKPRPAPPKPAAPLPQATGSDAEYQQRIIAALKAIYGDNKEKALDKVEELTSFIPRGKEEKDRVKGVRNFLTLTGKRLEILCHNLEKIAPKFPDSCPNCGEPHPANEPCSLPSFCTDCRTDPCQCDGKDRA